MKSILTIFFILVFAAGWAQAPSAEQFRQMIEMGVKSFKIAPEKIAFIEDKTIGQQEDTFRIRIYRPVLKKKLPVIYFVHGGGWVAGDINTHDNICRYLANHTNAIVVSVNYRRPPEFKFPILFNDVSFTLNWIRNNRKYLGAKKKLALVGDSGGGTLVAGVCIENSRQPRPVPITAQVLVNPALDISEGSPTANNYGFLLPMVLKDGDSRNDFRLSPLKATNVANTPQAFIVVGEKDELRPDGENYHQKLLSDGVASTLYVQPNMGHLGEVFCAAHPKALPAVDFVVKNLVNVFK